MDRSESASKLLGCEVYLKFENTQYTGSFKLRGAYNKIQSLSPAEKKAGVIASSAGNHAQGVAHSATRAGVRSVVVMPVTAPAVKVAATRGYGAEVILHGEIYDEAFAHAQSLAKSQGLVWVHPFEDEKVIAGQGTIGLELLAKVPDLDSVLIPVGGGGLISGIATAVKSIRPGIKIIGVQSEVSCAMTNLFRKEHSRTSDHHSDRAPALAVASSGRPHSRPTIADGIAVKTPSPVMWKDFLLPLVDEMVTVSDDEIAEAIVFLMERAKTVTEGSGAAAMAALMSRSGLPLGKKTAVVLCGGNIDLQMVAKIINKAQSRKGRLAEISVIVDDLPGRLAGLTQVLAEHRANILEVNHDRVSHHLNLRETRIDFVLEIASFEQLQKISDSLAQTGALVISTETRDRHL